MTTHPTVRGVDFGDTSTRIRIRSWDQFITRGHGSTAPRFVRRCSGSTFPPIIESVDGLRDSVDHPTRFLATPPAFGEGKTRRIAAEFIAAAPSVAAKYGHQW